MKAQIFGFHTEIYLTIDEVKEHCKPGEGENTCSWLALGPRGWECFYLNKPEDIIERRKAGTMTAMRDGCAKVSDAKWFSDVIETIDENTTLPVEVIF